MKGGDYIKSEGKDRRIEFFSTKELEAWIDTLGAEPAQKKFESALEELGIFYDLKKSIIQLATYNGKFRAEVIIAAFKWVAYHRERYYGESVGRSSVNHMKIVLDGIAANPSMGWQSISKVLQKCNLSPQQYGINLREEEVRHLTEIASVIVHYWLRRHKGR